jgi:glucose dehydrogenase
MTSTKPPRLLGSLLALLGLALAIGGIDLPQQAGGLYFLITGAGIVVCGVLIALGKRLGALLYVLVFAVMVIWSVVEIGFNLGELLPRVVVPGLLCWYIFSDRVRPYLT